jgi:Uma2 family endonuclease
MVSSAIHLKNRLSDEEFFDLCQINELRLERNKNGQITIMEPAGAETGGFNQEVSGELWSWNKTHQTGRAFDSSAGFTLPNSAIKSPDSAWIARDRWAALSPAARKKFPPISPDFVLEIRSESDRLSELKEKMTEYIQNGVRLGWLIDRQAEKTYIYRLNGTQDTVDFNDYLSGEDVLVGFRLRIADLLWED